MSPWLEIGIGIVGILQVAGLWLASQFIDALKNLTDKVGDQNGRVAKLEAWREGHEKHTDDQNDRLRDLEGRNHLDDSWRSNDRRKKPRRGLTEE